MVDSTIIAEQALLGSLMLNTSIISRIRTALSQHDFSDPRNQTLFQAILDAVDNRIISVNGKRKPLDLQTFWAYLNETKRADQAGGHAYLCELVENTSHSAAVDYHLSILKNESYRQKIKNIARIAGDLQFEELQKKVQSLASESEDSRIKPFSEADTGVCTFLLKEPPEHEYIFERLLPKGIVGGLIGFGGVSKSSLMISLLISMASGKPVLNHFQPTKCFKALGLFAEDPEEELHRRLYRITQNLFPEIKPDITDALLENLFLKSVFGRIGPLMKLEHGNPIRSEWFTWLRKTIELHCGLEVLMLDPKSRFFGLEENSNEHCTAWIVALEELSREFGLTILFSHHASKASGGALNQSSSRGGSALVDSCRWIANLKSLNEKKAEKFNVDPRSYVEFDISKNNYAPSMPRPFYLKRGKYGVLESVDLERERIKDLAGLLCELLSDLEEPLTKRELFK